MKSVKKIYFYPEFFFLWIKCYFVITPTVFECLHFEIIKSVYSEPLFAIPGSIKCSMWDFDYRGTFFGPSHPNNGGPPVPCNQDQSRIKISIQRATRLRTYDFCRNYFLKTFYKRNTSKSELLLSHSAEHIC